MIRFRDFLSTREAGQLLGVGSDQVINYIQTGRLYARQIGDKSEYIIHPVDLERLIRFRDKVTYDVLKPDVMWIDSSCHYLLKKIKEENFDPDVIVAIAHGGTIPAAFFSSHFRVPLISVETMHYDGQKMLPRAVITRSPIKFYYKNTLVVDDLVDSGESMKLVCNHLILLGAENIKTAVLHKKPHTIFSPDWYVDVVEGWVVYPWEDNE